MRTIQIKVTSMTRICSAFLLIGCCLFSCNGCAEESKTIVVDKTKFSDIYPAVWLSPSTGEITSLKTKSETPPEEKYEIWIEPSDPEIAFVQKGLVFEKCGFALLGAGSEQFANPTIPAGVKLERRALKTWYETEKGPSVLYCRAKNVECLLMITAWSKKDELLKFEWRLLKKP